VKLFPILLLLLVACRNQETNERLARVEKKLDAIQQEQQPARVPDQPTPALTTAPVAAAQVLSYSNVQLRQDVAESLAAQGLAEFVGPKDDEKFGVVLADPKFGTLLYSRASEPGLYNVVRRVKATLPLSDEKRAELLAILAEEK
jgi:hypothetical protein